MTQERASGVFLGLLAQMVEARSGLHHHRDLDLFSERVSARALEAGFESLVDYYYLLRYDDPASAELDRLIETLVVNETFFFRESPPLHALVDTLAPMVHAGRRPRVWSAACATGEEPVTLTVMLEQAGLGGKVDIVATDISHRVLERARRGDYGLRAHRAIPDGLPPWIRIERDRAVVSPMPRASRAWASSTPSSAAMSSSTSPTRPFAGWLPTCSTRCSPEGA
jgi:chemotaxis protein methyltransferase CheR